MTGGFVVTAQIASKAMSALPVRAAASRLHGQVSTVWTRCPSCQRVWQMAQLNRVRTASGWRLCCPDWECGVEAGHDPVPYLAGSDGSAGATRLVAGQRLVDAW